MKASTWNCNLVTDASDFEDSRCAESTSSDAMCILEVKSLSHKCWCKPNRPHAAQRLVQSLERLIRDWRKSPKWRAVVQSAVSDRGGQKSILPSRIAHQRLDCGRRLVPEEFQIRDRSRKRRQPSNWPVSWYHTKLHKTLHSRAWFPRTASKWTTANPIQRSPKFSCLTTVPARRYWPSCLTKVQ